MNYRHAYHAGNHADVFKHLLLTRCLALLQKKPAPLAYIDTHAGIGLYDLQGEEAVKTGEWQEGVGRLWSSTESFLTDYLYAVSELNEGDELRYYPGSPEFARCLTRSQDRLHLNEKHPVDGQLLKENMRLDRRASVHLGDGWHVPQALLPTEEKRVLMLIDPPFEEGNELERCVQALQESVERMRQAIFVSGIRLKILRSYSGFIDSCRAVMRQNYCALSCMSIRLMTQLGSMAQGWLFVTLRGAWRKS